MPGAFWRIAARVPLPLLDQENVRDSPAVGRRRERTLATVLFTDIVGSTELAAELGDRRWQELLARHHRVVRRNLKRFGGREVDTAGDGFFATFDRPTDAVRCACAIVDDVRHLGAEIRAGVHTGEVESGQAGVRGIAVHVGARVMGAAGAGEVVVSSTVRDLVGGAGLELTDRGTHRLKGVDDEWRLFAVTAVDGEPLAPPLEPAEAERRRAEIEPSTPRRRPWIIVVAAVALVLVAWIGSLVIGGDDEKPAATSTTPRADSLIAFDPETGALEHQVPSALRHFGPPRIAVDGSEVWVRSQDLAHIDGSTGEMDRKYVDFACCDAGGSLSVAIGARTVWAPSGAGDAVSPGMLNRLDPESGDVLDPIRLRRSSPPSDVAVGLDAVWVPFRDGTVERRDPFTGELLDEFDVPASIDAIVIAGSNLWALDQFASEVIALDPASGAEIARIPLGGSPRFMAADDRRVWVLDPSTSTVTPISVSTGEAASPIGPLGELPTGLAVGPDAVWVSNTDGVVYRVDPTDGSTSELEVGVPLSAIALDPETGLLWLTVGP
jgi:class 3 adenylate cyclase/streptogramin lyase